eukprot:TRINITY_DN4543_c0_g1_i2.p1 TRINITY_DN4543_c0_g1~~TRINITY_DN4543_c0_g1_i2.p1  ORF type:complete len:508 (+),score=116.95 TRINITY_DN4543_c0_g1_i2:94-1617(+)
MLKKTRTVAIDKNEVDFMVLEYSCVDGAVLSRLGNHSKESRWKIQAGLGTRPVEIKVCVDKSVLQEARCGVECDGERVFPGMGNDKSSKMFEDVRWKKPFRGQAKGIGVKHFFEVTAAGDWRPATLTSQREDGLFEAMVTLPDVKRPGEFKEVFMPGFQKEEIRQAGTKEPLRAPERSLNLEVPKNDPLRAILYIDDSWGGKDLMTHYFARPTPAPGSGLSDVKANFKVNVARTEVLGDMGHHLFSEFIKNEVYLMDQVAPSAQKKMWTIAIGPHAVHNIQLEKKWKSKIATLTVDDATLIEAAGEDLDCQKGQWECKFLFKGEKLVNFEVNETNADGDPLEAIAKLTHRIPFTRECMIKLNEEADLRSAELFIDGVPFSHLPQKPTAYTESNLTLTPEAFTMSYRLLVPYKVNLSAKRGIEAKLMNAANIIGNASPKLANPMAAGSPLAGASATGWLKHLQGMLSCCTNPSHVDAGYVTTTAASAPATPQRRAGPADEGEHEVHPE